MSNITNRLNALTQEINIWKIQRRLRSSWHKHRYWWIGAFIGLVCTCFFAAELICYRTSNITNFLSIVGLIIGGVGVRLTFIQLRMVADRIDSYSSLFRLLDTFFDEIKGDGGTKVFLFYGPTILPGNVSFEVEGKIQDYRKVLVDVFNELHGFEKMKRVAVIVPPRNEYEKIYQSFKNFKLSNFAELSDELWKERVDTKKEEAEAFQKQLLDQDKDEILVPRDHEQRDITNAYFFSNGKRIIYAKPLHYVNTPGTGQKLRTQTPHLVGFTATDTATVQAFRDHFEEIGYGLDRDRMRSMYSKHLVSPETLDELISKKPNLTLDELADYDHDHFGGKRATQNFIDSFKLAEGDSVLDIGSGLGGPSRYIAKQTKCTVWGIELQSDRHEWAKKINEKYKKDLRVDIHLILGDAMRRDFTTKFKYAVAFLSILHFVEKERFLMSLGSHIYAGGKVYIEDFYRSDVLNEDQRKLLNKIIACPNLLTLQQFKHCLEHNGLKIEEEPIDTTEEWKEHALTRMNNYNDNTDPLVKFAAKDAVASAQQFSTGVVDLFEKGIIRGVRIVAVKEV